MSIKSEMLAKAVRDILYTNDLIRYEIEVQKDKVELREIAKTATYPDDERYMFFRGVDIVLYDENIPSWEKKGFESASKTPWPDNPEATGKGIPVKSHLDNVRDKLSIKI